MKEKLIQIADDIYFSEKIRGVVIRGEETVLPKTPYKFLRCLVEAKGHVVTTDHIIRDVWGYAEETNLDLDEERALIKDTLRRLRKLLEDTQKTVIVTQRNIGYSLGQYIVVGPETDFEDPLPLVLTSTPLPFANTKSVLFREKELEMIQELLQEEKALLLHGFGGVGKTSLARLFYFQLKDSYDASGWMEYHINLKNSMMESIDWQMLCADDQEMPKDANRRWLYFSGRMKNSREKKLLIIDNVDADYGIGQDPANDLSLMDISGWTNTDVILTSRLPEIRGYRPVKIENLGSRTHAENCVRLFYHYNPAAWDPSGKNDAIVEQIVELAGFNTMVIELLAKSSIYEESIGQYYRNLVEMGFSYPTVSVMTMRQDAQDQAIKQLSALFSLKRRKETERMIVLCFRLLPEGERVSGNELTGWLGYALPDIDQLTREGWINYSHGHFSIHPLVRQAVMCDAEEMAFFRRNRRKLTSVQKGIEDLLERQELFQETDSFSLLLRKLMFADCLYVPLAQDDMKTLIYLGDQARKAGQRDLAVKYYGMAYECIDRMENKEPAGRVRTDEKNGPDGQSRTDEKNDPAEQGRTDEQWEQIWKATYYYGYLLSYTQNGLARAEGLLREAVQTARDMSEVHGLDQATRKLAASCDHLGYILANQIEDDPARLQEAKDLLDKAISIRRILCGKDPGNVRLQHDLAWSQDNMGCLLTRLARAKEAEDYLREALSIREKLAKHTENRDALSELAWTCCNLGECLARSEEGLKEAEKLFAASVYYYERIEEKLPGLERSSLARTYAAHGRAMSHWPDRKEEAIVLFDKALEYNQRLEEAFPGVYSGEIDTIKKAMANLAAVQTGPDITLG